MGVLSGSFPGFGIVTAIVRSMSGDKEPELATALKTKAKWVDKDGAKHLIVFINKPVVPRGFQVWEGGNNPSHFLRSKSFRDGF